MGGYTLQELADELGRSRARVRQLWEMYRVRRRVLDGSEQKQQLIRRNARRFELPGEASEYIRLRIQRVETAKAVFQHARARARAARPE